MMTDGPAATRPKDGRRDRKHRGGPAVRTMDDIHYREYKVLLQPNQFSDPSRFEEYWHALCRIAETCGVGAATNKNAFHRLIREVLFYDTNRFDLYKNAFILRKRTF